MNHRDVSELAQVDAWEIKWVVRSLDLNRNRLVPLLERLGLTIYTDDNGAEFISRRAFVAALAEVADRRSA